MDDFNIFAPSLISAKNAVLDLTKWLYENHGLTHQASKTHFLDVESYRKQFLLTVEEQLSDKTELLAQSLFGHGYVLDEEDVEESMDDAQVVALLEMLVDAISEEGGVDYRIVGFAARRLKKVRLDRAVASEVLEILVENIDRLMPVMDAVAQLVVALLARTTAPKRIAKSLLQSLCKAKVSHHAIWILTILERERRWGFAEKLANICRSADCDAIKRFSALAIAQSGGSFRLDPTEFEGASPLVRLALLRTQTKPERKGLRLKGALEGAVP